ncbi:MAG: transporter, family, glucarate transporter [Bryobacterales bacterium]|jgi:ACS family glucarate transporter-like MFS transporter|nr:transporter, family, glucarate transporter [Bryobacterales bacterium]
MNTTQKPTKVRYWVVFFAVTLAIITYIDRVALSQAAPQIIKDLNLTKTQMGWVFFSFITAYAMFEIPSGYMGDKLGPRNVLMRIVVAWSVFIAATGQAFNWISLLIIQTLFGAGEAGAFPNIAKAFSVWLPQDERVRAQGIIWLSARWGGAFTPGLVFFIFQVVSWRTAFGLFGILGAIWAVLFYRWFRDNPADNPKVNAAELALLRDSHAHAHGTVPWGKFFRSPQVWMLGGQYFCLSYSWYFSITWLPTYLKEARHLDPTQKEFAILAGLPLFLGGIGSLFSGFIAKPLTRMTGSVTATRRLLGCTGFLSASGLIVLSTFIGNPILAVVALAFASFSNDLVMPGSWGACMDVGGRNAGTLSGTMNMMGNLGGAVASAAAPYILGFSHDNWNVVLYTAAAVYFLGTFFWLTLDPVTPIDSAA